MQDLMLIDMFCFNFTREENLIVCNNKLMSYKWTPANMGLCCTVLLDTLLLALLCLHSYEWENYEWIYIQVKLAVSWKIMGCRLYTQD